MISGSDKRTTLKVSVDTVRKTLFNIMSYDDTEEIDYITLATLNLFPFLYSLIG